MTEEVEVVVTTNVTEVVVPDDTVVLPTVINDLTNVDTSNPQEDEFLRYNASSNKWVNEAVTFTSTVNGLSDTNLTNLANNQLLQYDSASGKWVNVAAAIQNVRVTETQTTSDIADNASADISFSNLGKSYSLYKIQTSAASWVRIYSDTTARSNDASRVQTDDPSEGAGVIAEVIATGGTTFVVTPAIMGFIDSDQTTIPVKVTNLSGVTGAIAVTITALKMEE